MAKNNKLDIKLIILVLIVVCSLFLCILLFSKQKEVQLIQKIPEEKPSPADHIKQEQIKVFRENVRIDVNNAMWAIFTDTNSMDPAFDIGSNAIQIKPNSTEDIYVGDIVSYKSEYDEGIIIHRVVKIDHDEQGWYALLKGDNNAALDPGKIRFNNIVSITVSLIY